MSVPNRVNNVIVRNNAQGDPATLVSPKHRNKTGQARWNLCEGVRWIYSKFIHFPLYLLSHFDVSGISNFLYHRLTKHLFL